MIVPEGTRDVLPPEWAWRQTLTRELQAHFAAWGYQGVSVPALELQSGAHPQDARAFKLIDRDGQVLALRSEFTTAIGRLVRARFGGPYPLRLQYGGKLWLRQQTSEPGRLREFTQIGVELVGVSNARADAELLELARSALARVGVAAQLEVGHPGFVDAVLEDSGVPERVRGALHAAIDRKAMPEVRALLGRSTLNREATRVLETLPELYGGPEVLSEARKLPLGPRARRVVERLADIQALYEAELLFDLGMSRRYEYYTGFTFRAYSASVAQPLLGGGRYDTGIPGAGFALGLERLTLALGSPPPGAETVLALDFPALRWAQAQGLSAELAWTDDPQELARYARARGIRRFAREGRLEDLEVRA